MLGLILLIVVVIVGLKLLPEIEVDKDGNEILDGRTPPPPCDYHTWDKTSGVLVCKVCGYRPS